MRMCFKLRKVFIEQFHKKIKLEGTKGGSFFHTDTDKPEEANSQKHVSPSYYPCSFLLYLFLRNYPIKTFLNYHYFFILQ